MVWRFWGHLLAIDWGSAGKGYETLQSLTHAPKQVCSEPGSQTNPERVRVCVCVRARAWVRACVLWKDDVGTHLGVLAQFQTFWGWMWLVVLGILRGVCSKTNVRQLLHRLMTPMAHLLSGWPKKSSNFIFTTKMVIPKSLKFMNSGSEMEKPALQAS